MSLVSVESSHPTSLIETKSQIILKHLGNMDGKSLEKFKKALCELKPRGGAGPIRMENLKDKSLKEIVEFIFKCHTERHGTQTVRMTLAEINENQTRMLIDRELRVATQRRKSMEPKKNEAMPLAMQRRKSMETEKNEASTSKVMVDNQDGKQVHTSARKIMVPIAPRVPWSELSAKKVEREKDRGAVLEAPKNKEGTAIKNEGPAHNPPEPASTSKVMVDKQDGKQVHTSARKIMVPIAPPVPWSELSAKNVKREQDRDAVLEAPKNREGTASKNEGPAHNPPKPASTSKVMVDKQVGKQVHTSAPKIMILFASPVPWSELSVKKVEREQDRDAVLEAPKNREGTAIKNEGPARNPPKPAMQRRKSMETETNEASTSKVMVDKQDGKQVHTSARKMMVPIAPRVPWSELSAKKVEREKDRGAVLEAPKNREGTAIKNEGPAYHPPKPASTSKVMVDNQGGKQVHTYAPNIMVPISPRVPWSELSAKNVKREQDRGAVLEAPKNREGTASKNEGPAHNPPEPATHRRKSTVPKKIEAMQRRKSMETETNEASTSKVMVDKQGGEVVTETVIVIDDDDDDDDPFSEPSAKKIKIEQDRGAMLEAPRNREGTASINEGPAHNPPKPEQSQSENAPPSIDMEKQTSNIFVTHLKKLKEGDIEKFKEILCSEKPPFKNGEIQMSDVEGKSLEEMVDLIIRCHTLNRGPATIKKVLKHMKENQIIMLIEKDIRMLKQQQQEQPVISSTSPI